MTQLLWKIVGQFLIKLNLALPCISTIPHLGICQEKLKCMSTQILIYRCLQQLYSELPKTGSNSNTHQLGNGQILGHPYNKILLSNEKKKIMICGIQAWLNLKNIMLNKKKPYKKIVHYMIPCIGYSEKGKTTGIKISSIIARLGASKRRLTTKRDKGTFQEDENVFIIITVVMVMMSRYKC